MSIHAFYFSDSQFAVVLAPAAGAKTAKLPEGLQLCDSRFLSRAAAWLGFKLPTFKWISPLTTAKSTATALQRSKFVSRDCHLPSKGLSLLRLVASMSVATGKQGRMSSRFDGDTKKHDDAIHRNRNHHKEADYIITTGNMAYFFCFMV